MSGGNDSDNGCCYKSNDYDVDIDIVISDCDYHDGCRNK